jgi:ABC-type nitrate/sulfonate/bicarbonate transport system ATPase subunit
VIDRVNLAGVGENARLHAASKACLEAAFLADRVVVLGQKPTQIVETLEIDILRPRHTEDPALFEIHRRIMGLLS